MAIELPSLPYEKDALAPHISAETLEYHYGKHHRGYVNKLNAAIEADPALAGRTLEDLIQGATGGVYNCAAQTYNHTFYWNCMSPNGGGEPTGAVHDALTSNFGSVSNFKEQFSKAAAGHFGSGWAWLVKEGGVLRLMATHDADCPLKAGAEPVLTCDVWEHAYYIDYRNARASYIDAWWNLVNWDFVAQNL